MQAAPLDGDFLQSAGSVTDPQTIVRINDVKIHLNDNRKKVLYGRYTLFAVVVLAAFAGFSQYYYTDGGEEALIGAMVTGAVYLVCAIASFRYPLAGLAIGLSIYALDHLSLLVLNPGAFLQGWGIKVAIITGLALSVHAAIERKKLVRQLAEFPLPSSEVEAAVKLREVRRTKQVKQPAPAS